MRAAEKAGPVDDIGHTALDRIDEAEVFLRIVLQIGIPDVDDVQAFASRWIYARTPDGRTDRSRPKKPLSPWADVGDAAAYLFGWLKPGSERDERRPREQYATSTTAATHRAMLGGNLNAMGGPRKW